MDSPRISSATPFEAFKRKNPEEGRSYAKRSVKLPASRARRKRGGGGKEELGGDLRRSRGVCKGGLSHCEGYISRHQERRWATKQSKKSRRQDERAPFRGKRTKRTQNDAVGTIIIKRPGRLQKETRPRRREKLKPCGGNG